MKKSWIIGLAVLAGLCVLAPFASQAPDPVQKLVGLPGGAGTVMKAAAGVLVTACAVVLLGKMLK